MHIIHIASELAPIAKVGGLADVVSGLSREVSNKGHDVDIIIPKYDLMDLKQVRDLHIDYHDLIVKIGDESFHNTVWKGWVDNLKVYFVEPHHPKHFFNRGCYYGCKDDAERFLYFSLAAHEFLKKKTVKPDILHLHDWQTAIIPALLDENDPKTVITLHNLDYQGRCSKELLKPLKLKNPAPYLDPHYDQDLNLLRGGILTANFITTVSPTYACEVVLPKEGRSLDDAIRQRGDKFKGILNGVDYDYWSPEKDRYLPAPFSPREIPKDKDDIATLDKKGYVKKILREKLNLAHTHSPIVGVIARLVPQKGVDLIQSALKKVLELDGQFVLLGSSPIPEIADLFHELKLKYAENSRVHFVLHHQEDLAHLIFGGADMFLVPSLFEPCGLTQMIALKYGTIPIVRKTGGLADTIQDIDHSKEPSEVRNGYVFEEPTPKALDGALERAFETWYQNPDKWRKLMIQGMKMDFSWGKSSEKYLAIYKDA
ncbi:MAG: glycogen synthase [Chlamydiia bacterium]|nr:glycogen synthase [Chlamydiia bacterium]